MGNVFEPFFWEILGNFEKFKEMLACLRNVRKFKEILGNVKKS